MVSKFGSEGFLAAQQYQRRLANIRAVQGVCFAFASLAVCAKYVLACRRVASRCPCVCCMPLSPTRNWGVSQAVCNWGKPWGHCWLGDCQWGGVEPGETWSNFTSCPM